MLLESAISAERPAEEEGITTCVFPVVLSSASCTVGMRLSKGIDKGEAREAEPPPFFEVHPIQ